MKTIRALFHNGHLWNPDTKQRIVFRDTSEVVITVCDDEAIHDVDPSNKPAEKVISEAEQQLEMKERRESAQLKKEFFEYRKIMDRGQTLYFMITAGVRDTDKTDRMKTYFEVMLLEDLYIIRTTPADNQGRVEPCACVVAKESGYQLPYFEPVHAFSLNDAYSKTFVLYFNIFGKGTTNVYDTFFTEPNRNNKYVLKRLRTFSEQLTLPFKP